MVASRIIRANRAERHERERRGRSLDLHEGVFQGGAALEDFTQRTAEAWDVGQKKESNGVVLFVFIDPRLVRIEVGYGLEGALPDILAGQIIRDEIRPAFRAGNFDEGITRGVDAILRAIQGEYKGTGRTAKDSRSNGSAALFLFLFIFALFVIASLRRASAARRGVLYGPRGQRGWSSGGGWGVWPGGGGWGGGAGGGWSSGGGGGFSGGGGSFGGGGASGGW
jgi:uncharacterized protein